MRLPVRTTLSELIRNSLRHGLQNSSGNIRVELETGGQTSVCRVVDDGDGSGFLCAGRGLDLVAGLAGEIGGTISWRLARSGTQAELTFPNDLPDEVFGCDLRESW